ncbi:ATP synthase F1 subunit gamma [Massilibacteroides sp.]|uniref:ATP synthase F1 subunit gamma n=1 Tax=Massilibacteroides sp. TaxID=2034766 RepID=UPI0026235D88|nr:ATP synthase F1 subunit gamma [Massilibacteroides sp.]MDD4516063.1 ATP synthase F1 subunit gamma [Massilibacteroides sp.]
MASLKEVKRRIVSVEGTQKITVARQMISSALLHKSQDSLAKAKTYRQAIDELYGKVAVLDTDSQQTKRHKPGEGKVGVILISSNSGMCGAFNINIVKEAEHLKERYPGKELILYPIGKKIRETLLNQGHQLGFEKNFNLDQILEKPTFNKSVEAVHYFSDLFKSGHWEQLIVIYTHFNTVASQEVIHAPLMPYTVKTTEKNNNRFLVEPSLETVRKNLLEKSLKTAFHTMLIDSLTSEYAARTIAMQLASENANELLSELNITYNKVRQQNITTELLDIVGNSFA